jgi:hypothetical protein
MKPHVIFPISRTAGVSIHVYAPSFEWNFIKEGSHYAGLGVQMWFNPG